MAKHLNLSFMKYLAILIFAFKTCESQCPDCFLNTAQLIRRHGYEAESHVIETKDNYLLTLHRIPRSKDGTKGKQPIFLQHGLLASSSCWVTSDNNSLAFILSDRGYDVWLGNARGNLYSRAHTLYPPSSPKFWNFSWHEMGIYDLPAAIDHVANVTGYGGDILYVGHSMGTTMFYVFSSLVPETARNIKAMVSLAPVAYMTHVKSPIRYLAPWVNDLDFIAKHLGINEFLPSSKVMRLLSFECFSKYTKKICENLLFIIAGFDRDEFNKTLEDVVLSTIPGGTSTKTVIHYLQEISNKGDFKQYDYGVKGNLKRYGQTTPPLYQLDKINVPIYLMYGDDDMLANATDVKRLLSNLTDPVGSYEVPLKTFNHIDFLYAKDAYRLVYINLLQTIKNYNITDH